METLISARPGETQLSISPCSLPIAGTLVWMTPVKFSRYISVISVTHEELVGVKVVTAPYWTPYATPDSVGRFGSNGPLFL